MFPIYRRYVTMIAAAAGGALLLITLLLAPASLAWPLVSGLAVAAFASAAAALTLAVGLLRHISQAPTEEEQYDALLEAANDIIYTHDLAGNILTANPAVERLLGYSVAEALTFNIADILPQEQLQLARQKMVQKVNGDMTTIYELEIRARDGRCIPFEISSRILTRDGQPVAVLGVARDIRQRVAALEALRQSDERFRQLSENIDRVVWLADKDEGMVYVNPAYESVWGHSAEAIYADQSLCLKAIHEADRERIRHASATKMEQGTFDEEYRIRRPDGSIRWIHSRAYPIRDEAGNVNRVAGIAADITERRRAEAALRQSEATNRAIVAAIPDTLIRVGADNTVIDAHWKIHPWTQLTPQMAIGHTIEQVIEMYPDPQRRPLYVFTKKLEQARRTGESVSFDFSFDTSLGPRNYEVRLAPAGEEEVLMIVRDITAEKKAEEALHQTQKLESIGVLAGGIAHDFNNLLTGVLAQSSLAQARLPEGHPALNNLEKSVRAARRAADLTRQLLAYAGQGQFEIKPIDLNRLISENVGLFETVMPGTAVLELTLAADLPPVKMDEGQTQQVVMNLVINAAEAMPDTGGCVSVHTSVVDVVDGDPPEGLVGAAPLPAGRYICLAVQDNGAGIDETTRRHIFDPFFTTKAGGRGLGLSATLGIVHSSGGGVTLQCEPGQSTLFRIFLPPSSAAAIPSRRVEEAPGALRGGLLVIDDEQPVREAVHDILESVGMRVWQAADGREGVRLYRRHQAEIDLVLVDMQMPEMDGEETFWALHETDPHVRVLLSSGYSSGEISRRFPEKGPLLFLQKPYDHRRLIRTVTEAINIIMPAKKSVQAS